MPTAIDVTEETFADEVLLSPIPVLVDFWAAWCRPCRAVSPILDKIAAENPGKLKIVKINVDENPFLAEEHQVVSIPLMKLFVKGQVETTIVGAKAKPALEKALSAYLR